MKQKTVLMDESTKDKLNQIKRIIEFKIGEDFKFGETVDLMCDAINTDDMKTYWDEKFDEIEKDINIDIKNENKNENKIGDDDE